MMPINGRHVAIGDSLTPLRGVAAGCVVIYHIVDNFPVLQKELGMLSVFIAKFYLWVDFFFILSGYVLTLAYGHRLQSPASISRAAFLGLRLARIYPLHVLTLVGMILLDVSVWIISGCSSIPFSLKSRSLFTIPTQMLLLHSVGLHDGLSWNMPSWSISCEWVCYLLFSFAACSLMKIRKSTVKIFLMLVLVGYVVFNVLRGDLAATWDFGVIRCMLGFGCGALICRLIEGVESTDGGRAVVYLGALVSVVSAFVLAETFNFDAIIIPFFAVLCVIMARPSSRVRGWTLECGALRFLGNISYSLYMNHWLLIASLPAVYARLFGVDTRLGEGDVGGNIAAAFSIFLFSVVLSVGTYRWVEMPSRRFARSLLASRS